MKRATAIILAVCMIFTTIPIAAYAETMEIASGTCGQGLTWILTDDGVLLISGAGAMDDFTYRTKPWYDWREDITSVVMEAGITTIGDEAFDYCTNLISVTIPDSVTAIHYGAFSGCCSLRDVMIPDSVVSLGRYVFRNCSSLTEMTVPDSVVSIGDHLFENCAGLISVTVGNGVTSIPNGLFYNCTSLTGVTIPDSVTSIGSGVFNGCEKLPGVTIPDSVTALGASAFENCTSLTSIVIPNGVTVIQNSTFRDCTGLSSLTVGNGVETIDHVAFFGCSSLSEVTIPDSVTTIGSGAFQDCTNLVSVTLGVRVKDIQGAAFFGCSGLSDVILPDSVRNIGRYAFADCSSLTAISIPMGVATIGDYAFTNCCSLTGIHVSEDNPWYCSDAYGVLMNKYRTNLIQAPGALPGIYEISGQITSINDSAFSGCVKLTGVIIPDSVTKISDNAFAGCTSLSTMDLPEGITSIGKNAFADCDSLTSVTIPESVTSIGNGAFKNCDSLTEILVSENNGYYVSDARGVLYTLDWSNLIQAPGALAGEYMIFGTVANICESAFAGCSGLTKLTIFYGVDTIEENAFLDCSRLPQITIPKSVSKIGDKAFGNCTGLTNLIFTGNPPSFGPEAFYGITIIAYYPMSNLEWSEGSVQQYGGNVTWELIEIHHKYIALVTAPTCTDGGYTTHMCHICGDSYVKDYTEALGHTAGEAREENRVEADCIHSGSYDAVICCTVCAEELSRETVTIPATGIHSYQGAVTEPTCTEQGYTTYTCSVCGDSHVKDYTEALGHTAGEAREENRVEADCVHSGSYDAVICCTVCAEELSRETVTIPATGVHSYQGAVTEPTCTEQGYTTYTCSVCGDSYVSDYVDALGHDYKDGFCTRCGAEDPDYVAVIATGWSGDTQWTLTEDGLLTIYGKGNMKNYTNKTQMPWYSLMNQITDVVIEEGVTRVGSYAFYGTAIKSVRIPSTVTTIGDYAFKGAEKLITVEMPKIMSRIGEAAFYGCSSLKEIIVPEGIYTIWAYTFKGCSALEMDKLPKTLEKIDQGAFENCTALPYVFLPTNVEIIGSWSFKGCTGLKEVEMQWTDATEIREGTFKNCSKLTTIHLPAQVQTFDDSAFYGIGATTFTVPDTVTSIEAWCFARAYSLKNIYFEGNAPTIGEGAFNKITLTAYYPKSNATWKPAIMQNYGGTVTWKAQ